MNAIPCIKYVSFKGGRVDQAELLAASTILSRNASGGAGFGTGLSKGLSTTAALICREPTDICSRDLHQGPLLEEFSPPHPPPHPPPRSSPLPSMDLSFLLLLPSPPPPPPPLPLAIHDDVHGLAERHRGRTRRCLQALVGVQQERLCQLRLDCGLSKGLSTTAAVICREPTDICSRDLHQGPLLKEF